MSHVIPIDWIVRLEEALAGGRKAVAGSKDVYRRVHGIKEFEKLLELDPEWNGEVAICDNFDQGKAFLTGGMPAGVELLCLLGDDEPTPGRTLSKTIMEVARYDSLTDLEASGTDFAALVRSCVNWHGENRASRTVVKALAAVFQGTAVVDGVEVSRYSQGVEMLSFAAAVAPLLESDRLARVISLALETTNAYQPVTSPSVLFEYLHSTVGRYSEERIERLVSDLWVSAHAKRWWDLRAKGLRNPFRYDYEADFDYHHGGPDVSVLRDEAASQLWADGALVLPEEVSSPAWWADAQRVQVTNTDALVRLVVREGKKAYDALVAASETFPVMVEFGEHYRQGGQDVNLVAAKRYPGFLAALHAERTGSFTELTRLRADNRVQGRVPVQVWPYVSDEVFEYVLTSLRLDGKALDGATCPKDLSMERSQKVVGAMAELGATKRTKAVKWGFGSRTDFLALLEGASPDQRESLMASPHASPEDVDSFVREVALRRGVNADMLVRHGMLLNADLVREVYPAVRVSQRSMILAYLRDEVLEEVLSVGLEVDDTILGAALRHRLGIVRSTGSPKAYLLEVNALLSRVRSWTALLDVVQSLGAIPAVAEKVSEEVLVSVLEGADAPLETTSFLMNAYRRDVPLGRSVWLAGLNLGANLPGVEAVNTLVAQGFVSDEVTKEYARSEDPDTLVTASYSPTLPPSQRPGSTIHVLAADLVKATTGGLDVDWPEKPTSWAAIVPQAGTKRYPLPQEVLDLHGTELAGVSGSRVEILRSPLELHRNAEHMGNCTFGYNNRAESGKCFLGKVTTPKGEYNFALEKRSSYHGTIEATPWRVVEVNSRFNMGNVPDAVRHGIDQVAAQLS